MANRAYVDKTLKVKQSYRDVVEKKLGGAFEECDFSAPQPTADAINAFVAKVTHDKITNLVDSSAIDPASSK